MPLHSIAEARKEQERRRQQAAQPDQPPRSQLTPIVEARRSPPTPAPPAPPPQDDEFTFSNAFKQIPGGFMAATQEVIDLVKPVGDSIREAFPSLAALDPGDQFTLPEIEEPKSAVAHGVKGISQFLTAFLPFMKVTKGLGIGANIGSKVVRSGVQGSVAGVGADMVAFDPDDPLIMDAINQMAPDFKNPITDFLASDIDDSDFEKRIKRAGEGLFLGIGTDLSVHGIKNAVISSTKALKALRAGKKATIPTETVVEPAIKEAQGKIQEDAAVVAATSTVEELVEGTNQSAVRGLRKGVGPPKLPDVHPPIEEIPKFAGSINLDRINTTDDVKKTIVVATEHIEREGPVSTGDMYDAAIRDGFTEEDQKLFRQQTDKQRAMYMASRDLTTALAGKYERTRQAWVESGSPKEGVGFESLREAESRFLMSLHEQNQIAKNAGWVLQSFRHGSNENIMTKTDKIINNLIAILQQKNKLSDDLTLRLATLDREDPAVVREFIDVIAARGASMEDKIFEGYLNSILSNPLTHAANIVGNVGNLAIRPIQRMGAATSDLFMVPFRPGYRRDRFFGEAAVDIVGMVSAIPDATRSFVNTMLTGTSSFGSKIDVPSRLPAIGGQKGKLIRIPTRGLLATDEFFKTLARGGELNARAYRGAASQRLFGQEFLDEMSRIRANPNDDLVRALNEEAAYRTFTKELGKAGQKMIQFRDAEFFSGSSLAMRPFRYVVPFMVTPVNIAKVGIEHTPLKGLDILWEMRKGGKLRGAGGELNDELGKFMMGMTMAWWAVQKTASGDITGMGPTDPEQAQRLKDIGIQPLSVRVGGKMYSYARIEPFATAMGLSASAAEVLQASIESGVSTEKERAELVGNIAEIFRRNLTDKTFMQGIKDLMDAMDDPQRHGMRFINNRLSAVVPGLAAGAARADDPLVRRTTNLIDTIRSRLPSVGDLKGRKGLYPVRNIYGEAIHQPGNFWQRFFIPVRVSEISGTPGQVAIAEAETNTGRLPETISIKGHKIVLGGKEYDEYQQISGRFVRTMVESSVPALGKMTKTQQRDHLQKMIRMGRDMGTLQYIPGLLERQGLHNLARQFREEKGLAR